MAVTATFRIETTVVETLATNVDGSTSPQVIHDAYNQTLLLDAAGTGGTSPITKGKGFLWTLAAGVFTIDLTALPATGGGTFTALGLRLITALFINPAINSGVMNIAPGASNGYTFLGASNDITLPVGGMICWYSNNQTTDVAAGAKTIDLAGSGTDVLYSVLTFG